MLLATLVGATLVQALAFTSVAQGTSSQIDEARQVVIRTAAEWQTLWKTHSTAPAPSVDFGKSVVVGVFAGTKPTAGRAVEIVAVKREGTGAVVEYRERSPGRGGMVAQVLTSPFHLVAVPRELGTVSFKRLP